MAIGIIVSLAFGGVGLLLCAAELGSWPPPMFAMGWCLVSSLPALLEQRFASDIPRYDADFVRGTAGFAIAELSLLTALTVLGDRWHGASCLFGLPLGLLGFTEGVLWLHAERASEQFALSSFLTLDWLPHSRAWSRVKHPQRRLIEALWWTGALGSALLCALVQVGWL